VKIGDLVKVKDVLPLKHLVGHVGVITKERYNKHWVKVHISGETKGIRVGDLEVINESR